jgi:hypothetical protein
MQKAPSAPAGLVEEHAARRSSAVADILDMFGHPSMDRYLGSDRMTAYKKKQPPPFCTDP